VFFRENFRKKSRGDLTFAAAHGIIMMKGEGVVRRHGGAGAGAETERKGDMVYRFEEFLENEYGEPNPALLDVFNEMLAAAIVAGETELEKGDWRIRLFPECAVLYHGGEWVYSEPTDVFVYGDQSPEFWKKLEGE